MVDVDDDLAGVPPYTMRLEGETWTSWSYWWRPGQISTAGQLFKKCKKNPLSQCVENSTLFCDGFRYIVVMLCQIR